MIDDAELALRIAGDAKLDKLNRVGDILEAALLSYRCQYTEIDDGVGGDGLPLVDVLSSGEDIGTGKQEIELLAEHLAIALVDPDEETP